MEIPGLGSPEKVDRVDHGKGFVREHTIEIGETIIVFNNIGTISIIDGRKSPLPLVFGCVFILFGLLALASSADKKYGFLMLILGGFLVYWGYVRKPDLFLSIGTSDGRRTDIVSKNRAFLVKLRSFLRERIDNEIFDKTATINISAETISGGLAFGPGSQATGESGSVNN